MVELLRVENLSAGYGPASVIAGISFTLPEQSSLAVLGRNGVGKTTLLNTLIGVTDHHAGCIYFQGKNISRLPPEKRARAGLGWVPQERNIFRSLTVLENLTAVAQSGRWTVQRIFELFPRLHERRNNFGNQLSGGEQQMLAVGRALALNPKILLLDEPTEGLAPIIVEQLLTVLERLMAEEGIASIIIEQHARKILEMTSNALILERGRVVHQSDSRSLISDPTPLDRFLGIGQQP